MIRRIVVALVLLATACAAPMAQRSGREPVTVGIFAFNDFHGHLEPERVFADPRGGSEAAERGGAARLATALAAARLRRPYSVTVSAGDLIGASPLASSLFLDEPTVAAMNRLGLDFNAVGNHEFDRGRAELLRMQNGGCDKHTARQPCAVEPFEGARFRFLSASTVTENGKTLFPATGLKRFGGGQNEVVVGFIGLTLRETPTLVTPEGVTGLTFGDEAAAINATVPGLKAEGADAIVVLIHQGGTAGDGGNPENCAGVGGPIMQILEKLDPRVDVVVSGHTHQAYICEFRGNGDRSVLLTSAGKYGELLTEIALTIDPVLNKVVASQAANTVLGGEIAPDPQIAAYVARYGGKAREVSARPIGRMSGPAERAEPSPDGIAAGGSLGNLVADAQLAATRKAGARIALTNPFGIRSNLRLPKGQTVTFGDIHAVQPFGNTLVTVSLTGTEITAALESGLDDGGPRQLLAVSAGLEIVIDPEAASGSRVRSVMLDGKRLDPAATYRVTVNSFLASGGDGFTAFAAGRDRVIGTGDLEALEAWLSATEVRSVPTESRVIVAKP